MSNILIFCIYHSILSTVSLAYIIIYFSINNSVVSYVSKNSENSTFFMLLFCIFIIMIQLIYIIFIFYEIKKNNKKEIEVC